MEGWRDRGATPGLETEPKSTWDIITTRALGSQGQPPQSQGQPPVSRSTFAVSSHMSAQPHPGASKIQPEEAWLVWLVDRA